jgi:hypothetical protein
VIPNLNTFEVFGAYDVGEDMRVLVVPIIWSGIAVKTNALPAV